MDLSNSAMPKVEVRKDNNTMDGMRNFGFDDSEARDEAGPLPLPTNLISKRKRSSFLFVDHTDVNSLTYVYDANRSLRNMTIEALPGEDAYRGDFEGLYNSDNKLRYMRPTVEELQAGRVVQFPYKKTSRKDAEAGEEGGSQDQLQQQQQEKQQQQQLKGKVIKFGWIEGVYMRCLLNIWGVMLFLRLTWVIGQAGVVQGLLVICLANVVTTITAISMSAVSTNGQIKGGGIYFMISRSLGPEFGGAIGIMFTLANSISVAMYLIGFCDSLLDMLAEYIENFGGIVSPLDYRLNDVRLVGSIALIFVITLAVVGMDWVTRVQIILLVLLIVSQFDFFIGSFLINSNENKYGVIGHSGENFVHNLWDNYHNYEAGGKVPSFFTVFGVFFPAVTGIVAGANLSGDLKDPASAIPKGTLLAILTTFITYVGYGIVIGSCATSDASGIQAEYDAWLSETHPNGTLWMTECDQSKFPQRQEEPCRYGSSNDQQMMTKISYTGYLIYAGCFAATLSSAIASLVGAPRVLQALAKDKLYPFIHFFAKGYGANQDPFRGYALVFIIALGCVLIGSLDVVSSLVSNFFVAAYALINFSVFHASITKSPGWRPAFKYYSPWVSLVGTILCFVVMFLMDWVTALVTFGCICALYAFIWYRKPEANWGSSTQAQKFVTTLGNMYTLNDAPEHVKNYRPKILVFTGVPAHRQPLLDFANLITKKLSLLVCSHIETEDNSIKNLELLKKNVNIWLNNHGIKAFFSAIYSQDFQAGAKATMDLVGIGKLVPNMILLGFKRDWQTDTTGLDEYMKVLHHGFDIHMAMGILRLSHGCDFSNVIGAEEQILHEVESGGVNERNEKSGVDENSDDGPLRGDVRVVGTSSNLVVETSTNQKKTSITLYHGIDGSPLSGDVVADIRQFQRKKRKGTIDVWWLYDDGGLTLLLPYILTTRQQFAECSLRVFTLANRRDELDKETRNMIALLAKFRIDYSDVTVIPDVTKKANEATKAEFLQVLHDIGSNKPSEAELAANKEKTNRHLRLSELLRELSIDSEMVIMTLPMPRRNATPNSLYMSWLEMMTRKMPPFLLLRGNQTSVLTFYS